MKMTKNDFIEKVFDYENEKEWKYKGELPCLIDFSASWCGPCKMISPILDELSDEYKDKVNIYKVDVDDENELASVFNIKSVPSLLFVPKEGKPSMTQGALPKSELKKIIEKELIKE